MVDLNEFAEGERLIVTAVPALAARIENETVNRAENSTAGRLDAVFRVHGISKAYRMDEVEVPALRAVDHELFSGEFVVIFGPSGGKKSTLQNILGELDVPTGGEVHILEHDITAARD